MKELIKNWLESIIVGKNSSSYWWNLYEESRKKGVMAFLKRLKYKRYMNKYNAFVSLQSSIKGKPVLPHGVCGVFISSGAIIGDNCTIFHQVTIGSNTIKNSIGRGAPLIGNNVYIGCGAKIIGNVKVGDNVRIGANCVVTSDVPPNSTVVLQKPRIIYKRNNVNEFVEYSDFRNSDDIRQKA